MQVWFSLAALLFGDSPAPSCPRTCQPNGLHVSAHLQTKLLLVCHCKTHHQDLTAQMNETISKICICCTFFLSQSCNIFFTVYCFFFMCCRQTSWLKLSHLKETLTDGLDHITPPWIFLKHRIYLRYSILLF